MTNLINHLKQLDKDATPRPWVIESHPLVGVRVQAEIKGIPPQKISKRLDFGDMRFLIKNAKMILYLRNNLPQIISLLEAGEKLREAAADFNKWDDHRVGKDYQSIDGGRTWSPIEVKKQCPFCFKDLEEDEHSETCTDQAIRAALNTYDTIKKELE